MSGSVEPVLAAIAQLAEQLRGEMSRLRVDIMERLDRQHRRLIELEHRFDARENGA